MWNINAPRAYPLRDFHKICRVCTSFQDALGVKSLLDLLKGLWSYGGFKLRGTGYAQIFSDPSGETIRQTPNVFEVKERARGPLSPCQVWWGSDFTRRRGVAKNVEVFCLFVCLFVCSSRFWTSEIVRPKFAMKALEYRNDFDAAGQGKVRSCASVFNFVRLLPIGDNTKCRSPKTAKIGVFRQQRATE